MHRRNGFHTSNRSINDSFTVNREQREGVVSRVIHHTSSSEVSLVSVLASSRPCAVSGGLARRHDIPAFTSLRQMVKPSAGVTIVNVYNTDEMKRPKMKKKPAVKSFKKQTFASPVTDRETVTSACSTTNVAPKTERTVEPIQRNDQEENLNVCLATDAERRRALKNNEQILPVWKQAEAAAAKYHIYLDDYDEDKAKREWDSYYAGRKGYAKATVTGALPSPKVVSAKSSKEAVPRQGNPKNSELAVSMTARTSAKNSKETAALSAKNSRESAVAETEGEDHTSGAFYGTAETERVCMNAIQHILKAERELQLLQFTSNSVLPQAKQCLDKVRWVHECLKLFNTHFRDLQAETDEKLQKKTGNHFTINMRAAPKNDLPFPAHM